MLSDIFKSPWTLDNAQEGAAYGAAIIAAVGIKVKSSVEEVSKEWIEETERISPGADVEIYEKMYSHYIELYPLLKDHFQAMSDLW